MPGTDPITVYRGEDVDLNFTQLPDALGDNDISGWDICFSVSTLIDVNPATIVDGPNGLYKVPLTAALTDICPGIYRYDVRRVDTGENRVIATGPFTVLDAIRC